MRKAILFALIFAVVGIFVLGNAALLLLHEAKVQHMALLGFPVIIVVGVTGFIFGWKKRRRQ